MLIKHCQLTDLPKLSLIFDEYRVHFKQESNLEASTIFLRERIENKQAVVFAAIDEDSNDMMGFTLLYPMYTSLKIKSTWTLNDMFITEKYRKFGVATRLLEKVEEFGAETNAQWITLKTGVENTKAQALYEKFGFKKDEGCYYYYLQQ
ncbi:GNAT family N-acetyltransferase [Dyadobacter sp. CY345]|uniref:GNAT family N-acetyltransferase n=1 Tax=Dyadobacter sp. CY345 TaxID=2909335 RepID=UPI001F1BE8FC|nr:GNAT family N-acetyltransferase [Dyadobacter sp. CY345]MCF2446544.1 GNAT family N-acetyltransferase [Dyadobacter sp. CY345]